MLLTLFPNLYSLYLAFTNYSLYHFQEYSWIGIRNFVQILTGPEISVFFRVLSWTLLWTVGGVGGSLLVGLLLALLLNSRELKGKEVYRALLILPWAVPSFISIMSWKGILNAQFGAVNQILSSLGFSPVPWLDSYFWAKVSVLLVNVWLAFPFMMSVCLGALQSIPSEVHEAARVDGAGRVKGFFLITLPLLRSALLPAVITSFAFNFNQFNGIYLLTDGGPPLLGSLAGGTDILITYAYKLAFNQFRFALACAYSVFIFLVVASLSLVNFRISGAFKDEEE